MSDLFLQSLTQKTREYLIEELRFYYQLVSNFGSPQSVIQMPMIRSAYGADINVYPIIFFKLRSSENVSLGIGKGFVKDVFSDDQSVGQKYLPGTEYDKNPKPYRRRAIAERKGYMADITFELEVWGDTPVVRDRVVDETVSAFMHYQRERLLEKGIQILKINEGSEAIYPLDSPSNVVYVASIFLSVNAEIYFDNTVASITGLDARPVFQRNLYPDLDPSVIQDEYLQ